MKIAVIGAGAMGCLFGGLLYENGNDVVLIDISQKHIEAINEKGLLLTTEKGSRYINIPARYAYEVTDAPDLMIIFTKTIYSANALDSVKHLIGENTYIMTLQNGLGNVELIEKYVPKERAIVGMTNFPSDVVGLGEINSMGSGVVVAMSADGKENLLLNKVEKAFNSAGLNCEISSKTINYIWEKVAFNAAVNTLTTVTRLRIGNMSSTEQGRFMAFEIAKEIISVANKKGIDASLQEVNKNLEMAFDKHKEHMPSMMQDMLAKRITEVDFINGSVIKEAEKLGIDVPITRAMYLLVKIIEQNYDNQILM